MSTTLNEKIFDIIEKECMDYDEKPIIGKRDASNEIEILVLNSQVELLQTFVDELNSFGEPQASFYIEGKISEINNKIKELTK